MDSRDLNDLEEMRRRGSITEEEYQNERRKIINQMNNRSDEPQYWGMTVDSYISLMHASQFLGYLFPLVGFIVPILMWTTNKDNSVKIDMHGKNIINFLISWLIYGAGALILCFLLIGIPILIALAVFEFIFIIMATIKASNGEYWTYPFSFKFIQ